MVWLRCLLHVQAANQKVARLQNSVQVLQTKLQERDHQVGCS